MFLSDAWKSKYKPTLARLCFDRPVVTFKDICLLPSPERMLWDMENEKRRYRFLVQHLPDGDMLAGRIVSVLSDEEEARTAYDPAVNIYNSTIYTVQLFDREGVGELAFLAQHTSVI